MNAEQYRDELDALLKRAYADGYRFTMEIDVEADEYSGIETEYFFVSTIGSEISFLDHDLVWEREL